MENDFSKLNDAHTNNSKSSAKIRLNDIPKGGFFSFNGICTLKRYWLHFIVSNLIFTIDLVYSFLYKYTSYGSDFIATIICFSLGIIWQLHMMCLAVQRMRSVAVNPWKVLIPFYGPIVVRFFPAKEDQSNNKYLNYKIPGAAWLRIIFILLTIAYSGFSTFYASLLDSIKGLSLQTYEKKIFTDDFVECIESRTENNTVYYFNVYGSENNMDIIDTAFFCEKETFENLKNMYLELKESNPKDYLSEFCDFIYSAAYDDPEIDFYNNDWELLASFASEDTLTVDDFNEYNPDIVRFWYDLQDLDDYNDPAKWWNLKDTELVE